MQKVDLFMSVQTMYLSINVHKGVDSSDLGGSLRHLSKHRVMSADRRSMFFIISFSVTHLVKLRLKKKKFYY